MANQFMAILAIVAALLNSGIIEMIIKFIEQIYQGFSGAEKKALAINALAPLISGGGKGLIGAAIDAQVAAFNEEGVFVHAKDAKARKVG